MLVLEPLLPLHGGDAMNASCKSQTLHQFYSFLHLKDNTQLPLRFFFLIIQLILPRDRDYLAYVSTSLTLQKAEICTTNTSKFLSDLSYSFPFLNATTFFFTDA